MLPIPCLKPSHVPPGSRGEKLQISSEGLGKGLSRKVLYQKAQLKCLYTDAHSMGNEEEELETVMCLEIYDLVAITET